MATIFDQHPDLPRTVYLVDEEFIGRGKDAVDRALEIADVVAQAGFAWESSCRVDQVVHLRQDRAWHVQRGHLWRGLVDRKLRRCLFGVESGVTSVLQRFNKETTAEQNVLAIRSLTALAVPPRFTYITFDHLMTVRELRATYAFQGRTDLLMHPQLELTVEEIVDGVRDENRVVEHTAGRPFYTAISYMLVGMECLIGAAYTRRVQAAGLAGRADPSMGRIEATYADWRIGVLARWSQLWIDRNFALDYTLKSLEKILEGAPHQVVRGLRRILKHAAYRLLGRLIDALDHTEADADPGGLDMRCHTVADALIAELHAQMGPEVAAVEVQLAEEDRSLLLHEHRRWAATTSWRLINVSDPCGT